MPRAVVSALRIGTCIGSGNFGAVHKGEHPIHGAVAIKVYKRLINENDHDWRSRRDDLLAEGQRLKEAEHARIVRVYDISHDADKDKIYLVMELCEGGALQSSYEISPLSLGKTRNIMTDVALGLGCVHSRSLLHRDIKPGNILIAQNGRAKLGDFGLVTDRTILGYGSMRGYSDHIAIEVWSSRRTSRKSDIWAFGMTTYRLLHGKTYYDALDRPRNSVNLGRYACKLPWLPHIPSCWRRFVRKCMNDDPRKRYQSVDQVLQALEGVEIVPEWECSHSSSQTIWQRTVRNRIQRITHKIHSVRKHEWIAMSEPKNGTGRTRTLSSSAGIVSKAEALNGLETFLNPAAK